MPAPPRARALALALALALSASTAAAQEAPDASDRLEIADLDLASLLDLSVEAVSLREVRASEAAASVFVLTGDDLRRHGFRTLDEALRSVPGLFGYADGLYPMVGVRGMGV